MIYRGSLTSTVSTSMISTSTNFQKVLHKVVLVGDLISKFVLVELTVCTTQLVQILHSTIFFQVPKIVLSGDWSKMVLVSKKSYPKKINKSDFLNTAYLTDSSIIFTLKMESVPEKTIFGLDMMVKSGLEKMFFEIPSNGRLFFLTS